MINEKDLAAVRDVLASGHLAQGSKVREFETAVARRLKLKYAVAVNSGTSALHLALLALGVKPKDEVIIPSFVCTALLNAVLYVGAKPVIVDVEADSFNICPREVKRKINARTKAVIAAHMFGYPADMKALVRLGIPVIEDCAQTIGGDCQGKPVGSWGKVSVCSFYATKMLTSAEGGMILSGDAKLLGAARDLREYDNVEDYKVRYNYKMSDLQAALGLSQFKRLDEFIRLRKAVARSYDQALTAKDCVIPKAASDREHVYFRYVVKIGKNLAKAMKNFEDNGIDVRRPVYKPLHQYDGNFSGPVSDQLMKQCLSIPLYPGLKQEQISRVINQISRLS